MLPSAIDAVSQMLYVIQSAAAAASASAPDANALAAGGVGAAAATGDVAVDDAFDPYDPDLLE